MSEILPTDLVLDVTAEFQVVLHGGQDWKGSDIDARCGEMGLKICRAVDVRDNRISVRVLASAESGDEAFSNQP